MVYAGSVFILSALIAVGSFIDFDQVTMRLSHGSGEEEHGYGFLEVKSAKRNAFVRVCNKNWNRLHTKAACHRMGFPDGLGYHDRVVIREDGNLKGIMLQDITKDRFFKRICHKQVLLVCGRKLLQDHVSVVPGSFSAFPIEEGRFVHLCREGESDDKAAIVCRHLGFHGGYDHIYSPKLTANDTVQLNCQEASSLDDCRSSKADEKCLVVNFVCYKNMTFVLNDMNIEVQISPFCTGDTINIVKQLEKDEVYHVKYTSQTNLRKHLYYIRLGAVCDEPFGTLEGEDAHSYKSQLGNCSSFHVNVTVKKDADKTCRSSADDLLTITITAQHASVGEISPEDPFFETNPGIVVITLIVVLILFVLALVFGDWKPALPHLIKESMPRVPPPSLVDVTDKSNYHRDFEASGLQIHIIK